MKVQTNGKWYQWNHTLRTYIINVYAQHMIYMCDDISKEKCPVTYTIIFFLRKNSKVTYLQLFTI